MKKLVLGLMIGGFLLGLTVSLASAQSIEVNDTQFVDSILRMDEMNADSIVTDLRMRQDARGLFPVGSPDGTTVSKTNPQGRWCTGPHTFQITTKINVANWIAASMKATNIDWTVKKPGKYVTDCIKLNVHSNTGVTVKLSNIPDSDGIKTAYMLAKDVVPGGYDEVLLTEPSIPTNDTYIPWVEEGQEGSANFGNHALIKLWNRIVVPFDTVPATYENTAVITVTAIL